jgi:TrmH family RNA methyltransferase
MAVITSRQHPRVKRARALLDPDQRRREGRFLAEGVRLLEEAFSSQLNCEALFYSSKLAGLERGQELLKKAREAKTPLWEVTESVLAWMKETKTSQGAIGLFRQPEWPEPWESPLRSGLVIVACSIRDPGNLGTIIRMGEAAGARGLLLTAGTVDPYHPKALRASMGSLFRFPVILLDDPAGRLAAERSSGTQVAAAVSLGGVLPESVDLTRPTFLVLGGESHGIPEDFLAGASHRIAIPMAPPVESLNVAMAAAILLYERVRQQGGNPGG